MDEALRFRLVAVEAMSGGATAPAASDTMRDLADGTRVRTVVLVEGGSDVAALEQLAARRGRDLAAERVAIVPLGGATSIGRFLDLLVQQRLDVKLAGLCDLAEEGFFRRALAHAGLGSAHSRADLNRLGFQVCVADLEDELIRAHGVASVESVINDEGETRAFRTFQRQPYHRGRPAEQQLRRFMGTHSGRKRQYADALVRSLPLDRVPEPLDRLLASV